MIVLDTNVASELMKPEPSTAVADWVRRHASTELFATSITLAEIGYGIRRLPAGSRRDALQAVADEVFSSFAKQVLPFDAEAALHYGQIVSHRDGLGEPVAAFDAQIASICRSHEAILATSNVKDFTDTGIVIVDPWTGSTAQ